MRRTISSTSNGRRAPDASKKDRLRRNQFGGFLSGPIIKNRTFWSFNYEDRRQTQESIGTAWWPGQDFRSGDFSRLLNPATNPATGRPVRAPIIIYDPITGLPFDRNIIPASRLHKGALNVIDTFLPLPDFQQLDPLDFTASRAIPSIIGARQYFGRVDHNVSSKDKVFGRFAVDKSKWQANQINPNFPEDRYSDAYNVASQWIHTFSSNVLHEFRFGINNWGDNYINPRSNSEFDVDTLGIGKFRVAGDGNRKFTPPRRESPASVSPSAISTAALMIRIAIKSPTISRSSTVNTRSRPGFSPYMPRWTGVRPT